MAFVRHLLDRVNACEEDFARKNVFNINMTPEQLDAAILMLKAAHVALVDMTNMYNQAYQAQLNSTRFAAMMIQAQQAIPQPPPPPQQPQQAIPPPPPPPQQAPQQPQQAIPPPPPICRASLHKCTCA
jgi:hypothetical protein